MKTRSLRVMLLAICVLIRPLSFAQKQDLSETVPKYDTSKETKFKGVVEELKDHICPISGGMHFHLMPKTFNQTYEVHVAPVKFVKM